MNVVIRRRALRQVDAISRSIAERRPTAAVGFESAFRELVRLIGDHPLSAPVARDPNLRQATMTRYPYVVIFRVGPVNVTIVGVFLAARRPSVRSPTPLPATWRPRQGRW